MKKLDVILIISIVGIAVLLIVVNTIKSDIIKKTADNLTVEIYYNKKLYKKVPLNEEKKIVVKTKLGENTIYVHDNGVEMIEATCPDKICVATGFITKPGQMIVCLPNKVYVEIKGSTEGEIDAISD